MEISMYIYIKLQEHTETREKLQIGQVPVLFRVHFTQIRIMYIAIEGNEHNLVKYYVDIDWRR